MSLPGEKQTGREQTGSPGDPVKRGDSGLVALFFIVGLALSLAFSWLIFPKLLYSKSEQPFDFSHAVHNDVVGDCESCHAFREDGTYAGSPTLDKCVSCHEEVQGETEDERIFVEQYVAEGKEVPWKIYSRQPDCVFFSHAAHVKGAGMECTECHGDIGTSESLKPYEENRITGYSRDIWGQNIAGIKKNSWDRMKMDDCGACHKETMGSKGACFQCHK